MGMLIGHYKLQWMCMACLFTKTSSEKKPDDNWAVTANDDVNVHVLMLKFETKFLPG